MRISAQIVLFAIFSLVFFSVPLAQAYAQTPYQSSTNTSNNNFLTPNTDASVPQNRDTYTQVVLIDVMAAFMCQLTGVDPTNPQQPCVGVNPMTGKITMPPTQNTQFGQAKAQPQIGGALAVAAGSISTLYTPIMSSSQYVDYLANNFGIVKKSYAAGNNPNTCSASFGYGFCGLTAVFSLWTSIRDMAYAMLTILFIAIGVGVMLRFKVDPRTVMTLQNQIPRVIIAILLITFSYAIAGGMVDLMWTVTYAGINFISNSTNAQVCLSKDAKPQPLANTVEQRLLEDPFNLTNTVLTGPNIGNGAPNCQTPGIQNGMLSLSSNVAASLGTIITDAISTTLGLSGSQCNFDINIFHDIGCVAQSAFGTALVWFSEQIVKLIIIVALLVALFRLWWQLIKAYVVFLIFVIMGPLWIVLGLVPGRPLGFEKWLRIIFGNLAVFPLVAFLIVFARILADAGTQPNVLGASTAAGATGGGSVLAAHTLNPLLVFIPPFIGNPNVSTFTSLLALGILLLLPSIPDMIKERLKASGGAQYGKLLGAAVTGAALATSNPFKRAGARLNATDSHGHPQGALAVGKAAIVKKIPGVGTRKIANEMRERDRNRYYNGYAGEEVLSRNRKYYRNEAKDERTNKKRAKQGLEPIRTNPSPRGQSSPRPEQAPLPRPGERPTRMGPSQSEGPTRPGERPTRMGPTRPGQGFTRPSSPRPSTGPGNPRPGQNRTRVQPTRPGQNRTKIT